MNKNRRALIAKCFERAVLELEGFKLHDRQSCMMDLESADEDPTFHLDLEKLLSFPKFDFAHDMYGIRSHMDRSAWPGKLTDCFLPRCARSNAKVAA